MTTEPRRSGTRSPTEPMLVAIAERFREVAEPYLGFDGLLEALKDGKIWLNDINLVQQMIFEWMILELRKITHEIAMVKDQIQTGWPSVLGESQTINHFAPSEARWSLFIFMFSGRDSRFAVAQDNMPGGALEHRLAEFLDYDLDDQSWTDEKNWSYPIPSDAPYSAPVLTRLLFLFQDERSFAIEPIGRALMELRTEFLPSDYINASIPEHFCDVLGETVELLLGIPDGMLRANMELPLTYEELLVRARMKRLPEEGAGTIELISAPLGAQG